MVMLFVWMCVMMSAFVPGGARLASLQVSVLEDQIRADLEEAALARPGAAVGAAGAFVRKRAPELPAF